MSGGSRHFGECLFCSCFFFLNKKKFVIYVRILNRRVYLWAGISNENENETIWNAMDARLVTLIRWTAKKGRHGIHNNHWRKTNTTKHCIKYTNNRNNQKNQQNENSNALWFMLNAGRLMQQLNPNWNAVWFSTDSMLLELRWLSWHTIHTVTHTLSHSAYNCVRSYFSFIYLKWFNENEKNRFGCCVFSHSQSKTKTIILFVFLLCMIMYEKGPITDPTAAI